jgi:hypothetical protein
MESWKKFCPDFEIIEWNEKNFDMEASPLIKIAIERRNWALAADMMRIFVLHEHGGIYVDTDIEIQKPLDEFLNHEFFAGYESGHWVNTAIIGSVPKHPILGTLVNLYKSDLSLKMTNLLTVHILSAVIGKLYGVRGNGKTKILENGVALYNKQWFYPISYLTHRLHMRANTHTIHYYTGTWGTERQLRAFKFFRIAFWPFLFPPIYTPFEYLTAKSYRRRANKILDKAANG